MIKNLVHRLNNVNFAKQAKIYLYLINGRKPWSIGYSLFKENMIQKSLSKSDAEMKSAVDELLKLFKLAFDVNARYSDILKII